jgi:cbb3-type cytochrome oxidase cytochrome c subunit
MGVKQSFKPGEKVLFSIFGVFVVVAVLGYVALEAVRMHTQKPMFVVRTHYDLTPEGERGSVIFRKSRCTDCHRAMNNGTNMGLDLDGLGSSKSKEWILSFLRDPEKIYGTKTVDHGMAPKEAAYVADMPLADLQAMATFISELKADRGSPASPEPPEGRSTFIDDMVKIWAPKDWKNKYRDIRTQDPDDRGRGETSSE